MNDKINIRNLIFGIIMGLIVILNIFEWTNFIIKYSKQNPKVSKVKNLKNKTNKHNNNTTENDIEYEVKSGYKYKKSNGESSTFTLRNLKYAENLINNLVSYEDLRKEYCETVNEIVKVDNGIMPGTTSPFEEVTYTQVDDAYREHLQKIAQIRQVFDTIYGNDNALENGAGCHYTGTHWNNANSQYKAKQFYSDEIIKFLNNHGYNREINSTTANTTAITKEEGAYIRANFNTFFGTSEVCHNIGRNHVNFPAIYSGNRPDLSEALLRLIEKTDSSFINNSILSDEDNVMNWYTANCVRYNAIGAENSKSLRHFYEYVSNF